MKKIKRISNLIAALVIITSMQAQTTWYFGNKAGLKFPGGSAAPIAMPITGVTINTGEGSSVLVDESNNVILYTDGQKIWNGSHVQQPSGGPFYSLSGHSSSTECALIVPIPGTNGTKSFIFTVNAAETAYGNFTRAADDIYGLRVSLATISGIAPSCAITIAPTEINKRITPLNVLTSERLSVTEDGKGGYWVLTHGVGAFKGNPTSTNGLVNTTTLAQPGESTFYAYHVTCATTNISLLDGTEVQSTFTGAGFTPHRSWNHTSAGTPFDLGSLIQTVGTPQAQINSQGQLKFSSDGKKVACTLPWIGNVEGNTGWRVTPRCQLFDFNLTTGVVGGVNATEFSLNFINADNATKDGSAGGLEFSPNGNYLYVTSTVGSGHLTTANDGTTPTNMTSRIYRYDITGTPGPKQLVASLPASNQPGFGYMYLGPDGRIYIARPSKAYIDVIRDPNNTGTAWDYRTNSTGSPLLTPGSNCSTGLPAAVLIERKAYQPFLTTANYCQGSLVTVTGSYTGEAPSDTYWELVECDGSGNTIPAGYSWSQWFSGSPGVFTFPGSNTLPCNKFYRVKLALGNACGGGWAETTSIIYISCNPTPVITGNSTICFGGTTTLCVNYLPGHGTSVWWNNTGQSTQCITVSPTVTTTYTVTVNQGFCVGIAYFTVNVLCNNPDFAVTATLPYTSSPNFTCFATPIVSPCPGLYYFWEVSQINSAGTIVPGTTVSGPACWNTPTGTTAFNKYLGVSPLITPCSSTDPVGLFPSGNIYRITHITGTEVCPWAQTTATVSAGWGGKLSNTPEIQVTKSGFEYIGQDKINKMIGSQKAYNFSIVPNPSNGSFTLKSFTDNMKDVYIYDAMGKIVFAKKDVQEQDIRIDISNLPNGLYNIKFVSEGSSYSKKIIKE
ncbi:MAG: T9SS type A sorting domain-containing protein [Bacteroidia bacterium]|nr:T9SS type A sorting domain-containing protein [Bacteroidia bacterium]